ASAAKARIIGKRSGEERLAAPLRIARLHSQPPGRAESRIGKEIDILDVDDHRIENCGGRLGSGELVDDDVVNKVAQRGHPPIVTVRSEITGTAKARDRYRIEQTVVGSAIEQSSSGNEIARSGRQSRNVKFGIGSTIDVAGAATDASLLRRAAKNR